MCQVWRFGMARALRILSQRNPNEGGNLTRAPKPNQGGGYEPSGKKSCLVCDSISTATIFTTEACEETLKIQSVPLICDSEKVLY